MLRSVSARLAPLVVRGNDDGQLRGHAGHVTVELAGRESGRLLPDGRGSTAGAGAPAARGRQGTCGREGGERRDVRAGAPGDPPGGSGARLQTIGGGTRRGARGRRRPGGRAGESEPNRDTAHGFVLRGTCVSDCDDLRQSRAAARALGRYRAPRTIADGPVTIACSGPRPTHGTMRDGDPQRAMHRCAGDASTRHRAWGAPRIGGARVTASCASRCARARAMSRGLPRRAAVLARSASEARPEQHRAAVARHQGRVPRGQRARRR
jgi:hypothetical protein